MLETEDILKDPNFTLYLLSPRRQEGIINNYKNEYKPYTGADIANFKHEQLKAKRGK